MGYFVVSKGYGGTVNEVGNGECAFTPKFKGKMCLKTQSSSYVKDGPEVTVENGK